MVKRALKGKTRARRLSLGEREVLARGVPVRSLEPLGEPGRRQPRGSSAEEPVGAVLVLMDVTRLRALERVRRDFVANLSHELKTPLTAIRGFSETLLDSDLGGPPAQKRFLRIIREHAIRLSRLTDDLLKLARIESRKVEPHFEPVHLSALVESVLESARIKAGRRALVAAPTEVEIEPVTDAVMLTEILQNLVDNAIQYSAEDGQVEIRTRKDGDEVRITVRDNGIGIPEKHQGRIFERFYRVDPGRSRLVGGTGLGLAIAKHLAEALHARIELRSRPGRGSRFTVVLRAQRRLAAEEEPTKARRRRAGEVRRAGIRGRPAADSPVPTGP